MTKIINIIGMLLFGFVFIAAFLKSSEGIEPRLFSLAMIGMAFSAVPSTYNISIIRLIGWGAILYSSYLAPTASDITILGYIILFMVGWKVSGLPTENDRNGGDNWSGDGDTGD